VFAVFCDPLSPAERPRRLLSGGPTLALESAETPASSVPIAPRAFLLSLLLSLYPLFPFPNPPHPNTHVHFFPNGLVSGLSLARCDSQCFFIPLGCFRVLVIALPNQIAFPAN